MKARTNTQSKHKTTRKNNPVSAFADAKWHQNFVRHVEVREFSPRTREAYLAWPRRLQSAIGRRDITKLRESEVADFLISLRHEHGLKDATVNQAVCAMRALLIQSPPPAPSPFRSASGLSLRSSRSRACPPALGFATISDVTGRCGARSRFGSLGPAESRPAACLSAAYPAAPTPPVLTRRATAQRALAR